MKSITYLGIAVLMSCQAVSSELPESYFLNSYHESLSNLSFKEEECSNKTRVLSEKTFHGLNLTQSELNIILKYKNTNAFVSCSNDARLQYYKAATLLRIYNKSSSGTLNASDELISFHDVRLLELEHKYKKIDIKLRHIIDKIKSLNEPFNLIESFDATSK